ncbi:MAG: hypothetical protein NT086_19720 [Proteobacteria bacterium]|nr:hypothetical protein [Pseudomonadota bacterium]
MTIIKLNFAALSEDLHELKHLKSRGWHMQFSDDGAEIIAVKRFLSCEI